MKKNGRLKVCIVGLGRFGAALARTLSPRCEVLAIDSDMARVNAVADEVQVARCLDVRDPAALANTVSSQFDLAVVSIAEELESSILCTLHLKRIGIRQIVAKARNDDHAEILRAVGANSTFCPEQEHAQRLALKLLNPNLLDYIPLAGDYRVMDVEAPGNTVGKSLMALDLRKEWGIFVIAVRKVGGDFVFLPGPDFVVEEGDTLVVMGKETDILRLGESD